MKICQNRSVNDFDINEVEKDKSIKGYGHATIKSQSNGSVKWNNVKESRDSSSTNVQRERKTRQVKNTGDITAEQQKQQEDYYQRYYDMKNTFFTKQVTAGILLINLQKHW